jgi:hypothetical protein
MEPFAAPNWSAVSSGSNVTCREKEIFDLGDAIPGTTSDFAVI